MDYRKSHLADEKGKAYAERFTHNPHRAMMWQLEQAILDKIIDSLFSAHSIRHLDFACGTGRILTYLEGSSERSVGVDVSPSMLNVTRKRVRHATVIEADITRDNVLKGQRFNLITAFRFFANAEAALRIDAMRTLAGLLDDNGYVVFNNHLNRSSTMLYLARMLGQYRDLGMRESEVVRLVDEARLQIVATYHLGVMPSNERFLFLPLMVLRALERSAARHAIYRRISQNLIYVCRRAEK